MHALLFHTRLLLGILGRSTSLIWVWRRRHAATSHATTRATKRSPAPTPFPGRTHQPAGAAGEDGPQEQVKTLRAAPSPMGTRRGCPRTVDTPHHCCPRPRCADDGWVGGGTVRAHGPPRGGRWRPRRCIDAMPRLSRSPHGGWGAMDPITQLTRTIHVGERSLAMAPGVVHPVPQVLAPACAPLFLTDGLRESRTAWLTPYGPWGHPERRQAQGPAPTPRCMPLPHWR